MSSNHDSRIVENLDDLARNGFTPEQLARIDAFLSEIHIPTTEVSHPVVRSLALVDVEGDALLSAIVRVSCTWIRCNPQSAYGTNSCPALGLESTLLDWRNRIAEGGRASNYPTAVWARHTTWFLCREMTTLSLRNIGRLFGGVSADTVRRTLAPDGRYARLHGPRAMEQLQQIVTADLVRHGHELKEAA